MPAITANKADAREASLMIDGEVNSELSELKKGTYQALNFAEKFELFAEKWSPKVIAEMNEYQFKIVKIEGDFVWHNHAHTDETFIVIEGELRIDFRDGCVNLTEGEMYVVPKGVEHKPFAEREVKMLLIEPRGVVNTGQAGGQLTAENDVWI